jgi:NADH-quinone oxidoreductase subunit C
LNVSTPLFDLLQQEFSPGGERIALSHDVIVLTVEAADVAAIAARLKTAHTFDMFLDVTAVDWPDQTPRFEVVHHFYSTTHKVRACLKSRVPESAPIVPTLRPLFGSAGYMERECHDMYGIVFEGNDDLRPILLYEGFEGHPLRKDYPKQFEQPLVPYRF